jgi:hypothetical protein
VVQSRTIAKRPSIAALAPVIRSVMFAWSATIFPASVNPTPPRKATPVESPASSVRNRAIAPAM